MKMNHNDKYPLDDLFEALQHQCERIDQYADQHPVSNEVIKRSIGHPSLHRRLLLSSAALAVACSAALVWLVCLFNRYVNDIWDLIPHLVIGSILLYGIASGLRMTLLLLHHRISTTSPLSMLRFVEHKLPQFQPNSSSSHKKRSYISVRYPHLDKVAASVAIVAVFLVAATPAYDGRSMSVSNWNLRNATLATANQIISDLHNASTP